MTGKVYASISLITIGAFGLGFYVGREMLRNELKNIIVNSFSPTAKKPPQTEPQNTSTPVVPSSTQVVDVTLNELIQSFSNNSVAATDWAKDKHIRVTGQVHHVGTNMFGGDRTVVVFKVKTGGFIEPSVEFWYEGNFRSQVGALREGQTVTCEGTFNEQQFGGDLQFIGSRLN